MISTIEKYDKYVLDKASPIPLYFQFKNLLMEMIDHGDLTPGEMIPTEMAFCALYDVSRTTIRQALSELVAEAVFYRVKGRGTFVSHLQIHHPLSTDHGLLAHELMPTDFYSASTVMELKTLPATLDIANHLKIPLHTEVIFLKQLFYANDMPVLLRQTYLPYSVCKSVVGQDLSTLSLTHILSQSIHTKIAHVAHRLEAVTATKEDCELFLISKITAIQLFHSLGYNKFNTPIEYTIARYRGDKNVFVLEQKEHLYL